MKKKVKRYFFAIISLIILSIWVIVVTLFIKPSIYINLYFKIIEFNRTIKNNSNWYKFKDPNDYFNENKDNLYNLVNYLETNPEIKVIKINQDTDNLEICSYDECNRFNDYELFSNLQGLWDRVWVTYAIFYEIWVSKKLYLDNRFWTSSMFVYSKWYFKNKKKGDKVLDNRYMKISKILNDDWGVIICTDYVCG